MRVMAIGFIHRFLAAFKGWWAWVWSPEVLLRTSTRASQNTKAPFLKSVFSPELLEEKPERLHARTGFFKWLFAGEEIEKK